MFTKLLLGPGKEKGFLLLGALFALQLKGYLMNINEYVGVSVGSIVAVYLVMGLNFREIFYEALNFNLFENWGDISIVNWFISEGNSGIVKSSKIKGRVDKWMIEKYGKSLTFEQLWRFTGKKLTITITDRTSPEYPKAIYMNHETYPNYNVADAIIESCSIPGLIEMINPNHIDGAFSDPFPIEQLGDEGIAFILQDVGKASDSNHLTRPFEQMYETAFIPLQILTNEKIKKINGNLKVIILKRLSSNIIPRKLSKIEKIDLMTSGLKQTFNIV